MVNYELDIRVDYGIYQAMDFSLLNQLIDKHGYAPKKLIIRYSTDEERRKAVKKVGRKRSEIYAYCAVDNMVFLIHPKKKRPYTQEFLDWVIRHEYRHIEQMKNESLRKEIFALAKEHAKESPKEFLDRLAEIGMSWYDIIIEDDAYIKATEDLGYRLPRKVYQDAKK